MNNIIKVGDTDYPFHFGMRVYWHLSNSGEIEFDEVTERFDCGYRDFLKIFVIANEAAIDKKDGEGNRITLDDLEFALDDNPKQFSVLRNTLQNSESLKTWKEELSKMGDESGNDQKPSD